MRVRAHDHAAAAGAVALVHALQTVDDGAGREVGRRHTGDEFVDARIGIVQQVSARVDRLAQVMRRDVGCHAHGNAGRTVHEKIGQTCGQNGGFFFGIVEVGNEIDRILFQVVEHRVGNASQAAFGVTHGRRAVAVDRTEVALAPNERIAHGEVLSQTHQRLIDSLIAVRVIFTDDVTHNTGALLRGVREVVAQFVHGKEHAAVHGLKAVAHVGQRTPNDHAHGVIKVGALHFGFKRNRQRFQRIGNRHAVGFALGIVLIKLVVVVRIHGNPIDQSACAFIRHALAIDFRRRTKQGAQHPLIPAAEPLAFYSFRSQKTRLRRSSTRRASSPVSRKRAPRHQNGA